MAADVKIVNVKASIPVRNVTPPIYGVKNNVKMTHSDILKCICRRAIVHEVLPDGSTVRLTTKNFREDHSQMAINTFTEKTEDFKSMVDQINNDEEDAMEPEEPDLVMEERTYIDGVTRNVIVGSCPECTDSEDEYHIHTHDEVPDDIGITEKTPITANTTKSGNRRHHKK